MAALGRRRLGLALGAALAILATAPLGALAQTDDGTATTTGTAEGSATDSAAVGRPGSQPRDLSPSSGPTEANVGVSAESVVSAEERGSFEVFRDPPSRFGRRSRASRRATTANSDRPRDRALFTRPSGGPYLSINVSLDKVADADLTSSTVGLAGLSPKLESELGFGGGVAAGWKLSNGLRAELELNYFRSEFDSISLTAGGGSVDSHLSGIAGMANVAYDFHFGFAERWVPHVGAGAGFARLDSEINSIAGVPSGFSTATDTVFAWQVLAGLGFMFTPRMMVSGDYRYFATAEPDFGAYEADIGIHRFAVSVRFGF